MPCVACFVLCPHFCFQVRFRMSRCTSVGAHPTATMCVMCVYKIFGALTRLLLCCRRSLRLFNMVAQCVEGMFSVCLVCSLSNILGSHVWPFVFLCLIVALAMRDRPLCSSTWSVESLIARELNSRLCVAVMFTGAYYVFRDFAFLLQVVVSIIFARCSNSV